MLEALQEKTRLHAGQRTFSQSKGCHALVWTQKDENLELVSPVPDLNPLETVGESFGSCEKIRDNQEQNQSSQMLSWKSGEKFLLMSSIGYEGLPRRMKELKIS